MKSKQELKEKVDSDSFIMSVDKEFKQVCDDYKKKIGEVTWNAVDYSYREITKILARKLKESKLV